MSAFFAKSGAPIPDVAEPRGVGACPQVLVGKNVGVVVIAALLAIAWNPPGTLYSIC